MTHKALLQKIEDGKATINAIARPDKHFGVEVKADEAMADVTFHYVRGDIRRHVKVTRIPEDAR